MKIITGGVTAATGFQAAGIHCGVKNNEKKDLALIISECVCNAAATYTTNQVKASPLYVTKAHLENDQAKAIICNSGNANACAPKGEENAERMCRMISNITGIAENDIVVASTGVIGQELNIQAIEKGAPDLVKLLNEQGSDAAAEAIMTTDLLKKEVAVEFEIGGKEIKMGAIAKGSGMIHPNMGTMLCFITTDASIDSEILKTALKEAVKKTFNRVSVDGDTSTNDMCCILANGLARNQEIKEKGKDYDVFLQNLQYICEYLAKMIAKDGEGATKLITCDVQGAKNEEDAELCAKSVASSSLLKSAMFGCDANWGRVLCAMGYSGAEFSPEEVAVAFSSGAGIISVCQKGKGLTFDEKEAKKILSEKEITIEINMNQGNSSARAWGCDLSYEYVRINGDYRS